VGSLEKTARHMRDVLVPRLREARKAWSRRTLWLNAAVFGALLAIFLLWSIPAGHWAGLEFVPFTSLAPMLRIVVGAVLIAAAAWLYLALRRVAGHSVLKKLRADESLGKFREPMARAFHYNIRAWWHSSGSSRPRGWSARVQRRLDTILAEADRSIQQLNDRFARPSGGPPAASATAAAPAQTEAVPATGQAPDAQTS